MIDHALELLTTTEMAAADAAAIAMGIAGVELMENAGRAVADAAAAMVPDGAAVVVLCGPGNNGGDGFVAARLLAARGYDVSLALLGDVARLKGDAAVMAGRWQGATLDIANVRLEGAALILDALFGAGLARPLEGTAAAVVAKANAAGIPVLAVDVPSGLDGTTGNADGPVLRATETVTFFRLKPGHLLLPGRELCGRLRVVDIGIPSTVLASNAPQAFRNAPPLWQTAWPHPDAAGHKYSRGHAVVLSGPVHATGAARLGARAALRIGAGLVTVASPADAVAANATHLTSIMIAPLDAACSLADVLADGRRNAVLVGPGAGLGEATERHVAQALVSTAAVVLDADALTCSAGNADRLFGAIAARPAHATVLTPHEGEFARLFPDLTGSKLARARQAAARCGAVVILKGADTVIAAPDGRAAINDNAPPWLATAGSGDVLAGLVTGLLAQHMPPWPAACAAVWLHGACAGRFGPGLIAEDLPEVLPAVLTDVACRPGDNPDASH